MELGKMQKSKITEANLKTITREKQPVKYVFKMLGHFANIKPILAKKFPDVDLKAKFLNVTEDNKTLEYAENILDVLKSLESEVSAEDKALVSHAITSFKNVKNGKRSYQAKVW